MKRLVKGITIAMVLGMASSAYAVSINVLEGADVSLQGEFFTGGWSGGDVPVDEQARADTLVDGLFFDRGHQWNQGTVWWDARQAGARDNYVMIDLHDSYYIDSFIVQADDNDGYTLEYWDGDSWELAMDIANYDAYGWGLQTRPNPADDTQATPDLPSPILTSLLRFSGDYYDGDKYFSVSEIQAFGYAADEGKVPEPSSVMLMGIGMLGFAAAGIRRRKDKSASLDS